MPYQWKRGRWRYVRWAAAVAIGIHLLLAGAAVFAKDEGQPTIGVSRRADRPGTAENSGQPEVEISPLLNQEGKAVQFSPNKSPGGIEARPNEAKKGFFKRLWGKAKAVVAGAVGKAVTWVVNHADTIAAVAAAASLVLTVVGTVAMFIPGAQPFAAALMGVARVAGVVAQVAGAVGAAKTVYDAAIGSISWKQALVRVGVEAVGLAAPVLAKGAGRLVERMLPGAVEGVQRATARVISRVAPSGSAAAEMAEAALRQESTAVRSVASEAEETLARKGAGAGTRPAGGVLEGENAGLRAKSIPGEGGESLSMARNGDKLKPSRPMDREEFERVTAQFREQGGVIDQGEDAMRYLDFREAEAATLDEKTILLRPGASTSAVREELIHAEQFTRGVIDSTGKSRVLAEIEAKELLIRNRKAWRIPNEETRVTISHLRQYRLELSKLLGRE